MFSTADLSFLSAWLPLALCFLQLTCLFSLPLPLAICFLQLTCLFSLPLPLALCFLQLTLQVIKLLQPVCHYRSVLVLSFRWSGSCICAMKILSQRALCSGLDSWVYISKHLFLLGWFPSFFFAVASSRGFLLVSAQSKTYGAAWWSVDVMLSLICDVMLSLICWHDVKLDLLMWC